MSLALSGRIAVFKTAAARAVGLGGKCDHLPAGTPIRAGNRSSVPPAFFVPEQLNRVTHCPFGSSVEAELKKMTATTAISRPPKTISFENAHVFGGQIFANGKRYLVSDTSPYGAMTGPVRQFDEITLAQSHTGSTVFGHWLTDDCALREFPGMEQQSIAIPRPAWADRIPYERLFQQSWDEIPAFAAKRLNLLEELGFSQDKAARHTRLRKRLRLHAHKPSNPGGVFYLIRGSTGNIRHMANETELIARLETAGVSAIQCESGIETMLKRCLDARLIIGIEGSQLAHAIYMLGAGGAVMAIQPPDRFCSAHHDWSRFLGMRYGTVVGHQVDDNWIAQPDEVIQMINILMQATD